MWCESRCATARRRHSSLLQSSLSRGRRRACYRPVGRSRSAPLMDQQLRNSTRATPPCICRRRPRCITLPTGTLERLTTPTSRMTLSSRGPIDCHFPSAQSNTLPNTVPRFASLRCCGQYLSSQNTLPAILHLQSAISISPRTDSRCLTWLLSLASSSDTHTSGACGQNQRRRSTVGTRKWRAYTPVDM